MTYTQIKPVDVFSAITKGYNVVICDFKENAIRYTNDITVADIRNYISQPDVAFFKVEEAAA